MKQNVLAVQSYGYIRTLDSGSVGSIGRLMWAVLLIQANTIPREGLLTLFPQGFSKASPTSPTNQIPVSLGQMMAQWFKSQNGMSDISIVHQPRGWGTIQDVRNTLNMAQENGVNDGHIHFVSDPVHIKRVAQIWRKVRPQHWSATFYGSPFHRMTWKERWLREPIARAYTLFAI